MSEDMVGIEGREGPPSMFELFESTGAILHGHFALTSGQHSAVYLQCMRVLERPRESSLVAQALAKERFDELQVDVVLGPALGAVILSHEVARVFGARGIFAEREAGVMKLRRGFHIAPGERVLVVEDVITTGGSTLEVAELAARSGGCVLGIGALVDRRPDWEAALVLPHGVPGDVRSWRPRALLRLKIPNYSPEACPMCHGGMPLSKPGSRAVT